MNLPQSTSASKVVSSSNPRPNANVDYQSQAFSKGSIGDKAKMIGSLVGGMGKALVRNFTGNDKFTQGKGKTY